MIVMRTSEMQVLAGGDDHLIRKYLLENVYENEEVMTVALVKNIAFTWISCTIAILYLIGYEKKGWPLEILAILSSISVLSGLSIYKSQQKQ